MVTDSAPRSEHGRKAATRRQQNPSEGGSASERVRTLEGETKRAIARFLERHGPTPVDELIGEVEAHPLVVRKVCDDLQRAEVLCTWSSGVYGLSDDVTPES
jgi:hypothetical protein